MTLYTGRRYGTEATSLEAIVSLHSVALANISLKVPVFTSYSANEPLIKNGKWKRITEMPYKTLDLPSTQALLAKPSGSVRHS